ncbi:hypothetical protein [Micromonospora rosaria]|uniref:hypothetical protein n=1 Tax=Micromonospora rosaria TaxID=47874 RepID=UPI000AB53AB8|nr:hypothetical protein [Micromonospora rosaria]
MLDTARALQADTGLPGVVHSALYGHLLAAASYTAALRDDRDSAWTLLGEAADAARRCGGTTSDRFNMLELAVYKISVSRVLGDYGAAVDDARLVDSARIISPERRARYWEDTALALHGRGRPQATFQALLAAGRDTPQEVRFRPWAQQLTADLLSRKQPQPARHARVCWPRRGALTRLTPRGCPLGVRAGHTSGLAGAGVGLVGRAAGRPERGPVVWSDYRWWAAEGSCRCRPARQSCAILPGNRCLWSPMIR